MSRRTMRVAAAGAIAAGLGMSGPASAAIVSFTAGAPLTATPVSVSFDPASAFAFTAASTGNGPGAAVATSGTAKVSSFGGAVTEFFAGSTIDQNGELYSFSAFPTATVLPSSAADDYIGLSFNLADGVHYGYAEVAGSTLVSYAYQTTAGATILTGAVSAAAVPEPASLALLVSGFAGAAALRRRGGGSAARGSLPA